MAEPHGQLQEPSPMMRIHCPSCKQALQVPDQAAGKAVRCPKCQQTIHIPAVLGSTAAPAAVPAAAIAVPVAAAQVQPRAAPPENATAPAQRQTAPAPSDFEVGAPLPDHPELGRVVKVYVPRRYAIGLAVSAALLVVGVPFAIFALPTKNGALIAPAMVLSACGVAGVLICGLCLLLSFRARVVLCEHGFFYTWWSRAIACPWTAITGLYVIRVGGLMPSTSLRFDRRGDTRFTLEGLIRGEADLASRIGDVLWPRLRPGIAKALDGGELVAFGDMLSVGLKGMRFCPKGEGGEEHRLGWKRIDEIRTGWFKATSVAGGLAGATTTPLFQVICEGKLEWDINTGNIANYPLLMEVLKERFPDKLKS
jgi:predicted Zn finger-like uncharacterized protein